MFRLTRPISILLKSSQRSLIHKSTPSLISIHKYNFAGGAAKDVNNVSGLGGSSPGENQNDNDINNPYLWDPHYLPCEESDFERHHQQLEDEEKGRYAIPLREQVKSVSPHEVLKRVSRVLNKMERANTDHKTIGNATHLYNDLGLDSLDQVEFGLALEEEFDIEIPDEEAEQIVTIGDAVELICDHPAAC